MKNDVILDFLQLKLTGIVESMKFLWISMNFKNPNLIGKDVQSCGPGSMKSKWKRMIMKSKWKDYTKKSNLNGKEFQF